MIVVDTNVIAYLFITGIHTPQAKEALRRDGDWVSSLLWRSEFRSVLALYLRRNELNINQALRFMHEAELLMRGNEYEVSSDLVLTLAANSGCSAYDCEFVALAQELGLILVTSDERVIKAFPKPAVSLRSFVSVK